MEKAYKFRIYPNKTQESLLQKTFGCVRFIYNHFLDRRIKAYEQNKKTIGYNECSKELTQLKKEKKEERSFMNKFMKKLAYFLDKQGYFLLNISVISKKYGTEFNKIYRK